MVGAVSAALDISERKRTEEHRILLLNELNHRVKNTLATVQSIATQSFRRATMDVGARETFEARLLALSRAHDVLTNESWEGANLDEIVAQAISPYRDGYVGRFQVGGPHVRLLGQDGAFHQHGVARTGDQRRKVRSAVQRQGPLEHHLADADGIGRTANCGSSGWRPKARP